MAPAMIPTESSHSSGTPDYHAPVVPGSRRSKTPSPSRSKPSPRRVPEEFNDGLNDEDPINHDSPEQISLARFGRMASNTMSVDVTAATPGSSRSQSPSPSEEMHPKWPAPLNDSVPLSKRRTIRVFKLYGAANENDKIIRGELCAVDLDDNPSFAALSYCWGEYASPRDTILCGDISIEVTKNCWSALWHLRKTFGSIAIWIDAICINQSDKVEKSIQIPLMGDIYSSAEVVYLWLGSGTNKTNTAMEYLRKGGLPFTLGVKHKIAGEIPTGNYMAWRLGWHIFFRVMTYRYLQYRDGLQDIFKRPWIERLWTLQEALLARKLVIMCGEKTIPWCSLVYTMQLMQFLNNKPQFLAFPTYGNWWRLWSFRFQLYRQFNKDEVEDGFQDDHEEVSEKELKLHEMFLKRGWRLFVVLYSFTSMVVLLFLVLLIPMIIFEEEQNTPAAQFLPGLGLALVILIFLVRMVLFGFLRYESPETFFLPTNEAILMQIRTRKATNTKDRYYGVHSLINRTKKWRTMPDYTMSLGRIYRRLFLELLRYTGSLDILLMTSCSKFKDVPSWVIDWRNTSTRWIYVRHVLTPTRWERWLGWIGADAKKHETLKGATYESESNWNMDANRKSSFFKNRLFVHGKIISQVSWCSQLLPKSEDYNNGQEQLIQCILNFQAVFQDLDLLQIEEAMSQLCCITTRYSPTDPRAIAVIKQWCKIILRTRENPESILSQLEGFKWSKKVRSLLNLICVYDFHQDLTKSMLEHKRVLIKCNGRYSGVGISCQCIRTGDIVTLISGVSMPMILRTQASGLKVMNPALLSGVMNGELWNGIKSEQLEQLILI
jgi:hypothetical protein